MGGAGVLQHAPPPCSTQAAASRRRQAVADLVSGRRADPSGRATRGGGGRGRGGRGGWRGLDCCLSRRGCRRVGGREWGKGRGREERRRAFDAGSAGGCGDGQSGGRHPRDGLVRPTGRCSTIHCAMCNLQCVMCNAQCAMCNVQCAMHSRARVTRQLVGSTSSPSKSGVLIVEQRTVEWSVECSEVQQQTLNTSGIHTRSIVKG
jgi:hypothetical protein